MRSPSATIATIALLAAGAASAQDDASRIPGRAPVAPVNWLTAPSHADVAAAYPAQARQTPLGGQALLQCRFKAEGRLGDCGIARETPRGQGFGAAALSLAPLFRGPVTDAKGRSAEGSRVQVPITFAPSVLEAEPRAGGSPLWLKLPGLEQFAVAFPKRASEKGVLTARVALNCTVAADGGLTACSVASEDPAGYGFGEATLPLAPAFKLNIWSAEGLPVVGGRIRVPIRYQLQQAPQSAATP